MTSVVQRNQTGFDALMRGHSEERRSYVMQKLEGMGSSVKDPWYLQLANITLLGAILEQVPGEYQQTVQEAQRQFFQELHQELDGLENAKASSIEVKMAAALERLSSGQSETGAVSDAVGSAVAPVSPSSSFFHRRLKLLLPVVVLLSMGVGSVLTSFFLPISYVHAGAPLSTEDASLLAWAKGAEGQLAHDLIQWNGKRLTELGCEQQARTHQTKLAVGNLVAISGLCTLFVQDPSTVDVVVEGGG